VEAAKRPDEAERLAALHRYRILDTPREPDYDDVVSLASAICNTPISVINLIDEKRQWFKAEVGLGVRETPLDTSICAHAILQEDFFEIPDTLRDPRLSDNPLCLGEPHLRFYAGALLKSSEGLPLGTLCVLDHQPRELDAHQRFALTVLARMVMTQIELTHALAGADLMMREVDHRVKNSLSLVSSMLNLQASSSDSADTRAELDIANNRVAAIADLHALLHRSPDGDSVDAATLLESIVETTAKASSEAIGFEVQVEPLMLTAAQANSLGLLVNELVTNALRHGFRAQEPGRVVVELKRYEDTIAVRVSDTGGGLPEGFSPAQSKGLGMRVAAGAARHLGGDLAVLPSAEGAVFEVRFRPET